MLLVNAPVGRGAVRDERLARRGVKAAGVSRGDQSPAERFESLARGHDAANERPRPARAVRQYRGDLLFLHVKDVEGPAPGGDAASYRFVELGRGRVDFPAVFAALAEVRFGGWAVVELDAVPDPARTPKESALISRRYLEEKLGLKV